MPDPQGSPDTSKVRRVALHALIAGLVIMAMKFGVYALTGSAAVFADALESTINVAAAAFAMFSVWLANRPADKNHPYGHGKIEFLAVGLEGWMILVAGVLILYEAGGRLLPRAEDKLHASRLYLGAWLLGVICVICAALAAYVYIAGRHYNSPTLKADGKHLLTDVLSTIGGVVGLALVQYTGYHWLDPVIALVFATIVLYTSWRLLWQSIHGLMDHMDPADDEAIRVLLDKEVAQGIISGYHKLRHRHNGSFHWVDLHVQVSGEMTVRKSHELATRIEKKIEELLGEADATAHVEPDGPPRAEPPSAEVKQPVPITPPSPSAPHLREDDLRIDLEPPPVSPLKIGPTQSAARPLSISAPSPDAIPLATPPPSAPAPPASPATNSPTPIPSRTVLATPQPITLSVASPAPPPAPITLSAAPVIHAPLTSAPSPAVKPAMPASVPPPASHDTPIRASEIQEP